MVATLAVYGDISLWFYCVSLMINSVEPLSMCLLAICFVLFCFLKNVYSGLLHIFKSCCLLFDVVVWKLLGMMTKFLGLGLGQNGPGDHKISDDEDEKKEM